MIDDEKQGFIDAYRESLERQRDLDLQNAEMTRKNDFSSIMSGANKLGMMYSNFPERSKMQYDAGTYIPAVVNAHTTYQTGLDKLRNNVTSYMNQLTELNEAIADLKKQTNGIPVPGAQSIGDNFYFSDTNNGTQFVNANNEPIRYGTAMRDMGISDSNEILLWAKNALSSSEYNRLKSIYDAQQGTSHPNFYINAGENFVPNSADYLSESDRGFLDSLGLAFGS